jgi:HPt (histidine-containing phosphotransfer) domain-containing protein
MDDYLSKPIDLAALAAMLSRWLGAPAAGAPPSPPPAPRPAIVLNPKTRRSAKVVRLYLDDSSDRLALLQRAVEADDGATIKAQAHALRGSSTSIGATRLAEALRALEDSDSALARTALARVESEAAGVRAALLAELSPAPAHAAEGDPR